MRRFFIEGTSYSVSELQKATIPQPGSAIVASPEGADAENANFEKTLDVLCGMKIGNNGILQRLSGGKYKFQYVGVIAVGKCLFAILPKYYTDDDEERTLDDEAVLKSGVFPKIMRTTAHFNASERAHISSQDKVTIDPEKRVEIMQGRIAMYRFLLEDYASNGRYANMNAVREVNREGFPDWGMTVERFEPVLQHGRPIYLDVVTRRRRREESNEIAYIQEAVLAEITGIVKNLGLNDILGMPLFGKPVRSIDDLGGVEYVKQCIRRELSVQFETRKKLLLRTLLSYLDDEFAASPEKVYIEGTGSFNLVWEEICKTIFNDRQQNMSKPNWMFRRVLDWVKGYGVVSDVRLMDSPDGVSDGESREPSVESADTDEDGNAVDSSAKVSTLIPDVVNEADEGYYILDAKYYKPIYGEGAISGQPGVSDILKQCFYQLVLEHQEQEDLEKHKKVFGNAFIMPAQRSMNGTHTKTSGEYAIIQRGQVDLEFGIPHEPIKVFEMNPDWAMGLYLDGNGSRAGELLNGMFPEGDSNNPF